MFFFLNPDDVPVIDTDSDSEEPEPVEADSGQRISDSDSESGRENPKQDPTTHVSHVEIPSLTALSVVEPEPVRSWWLLCADTATRWRHATSFASRVCRQRVFLMRLPGLSAYALFLEAGPLVSVPFPRIQETEPAIGKINERTHDNSRHGTARITETLERNSLW